MSSISSMSRHSPFFLVGAKQDCKHSFPNLFVPRTWFDYGSLIAWQNKGFITHSKIPPTYPWKIPLTLHQQFLKECLSLWGGEEVWGIFPGYVGKIIDTSSFCLVDIWQIHQKIMIVKQTLSKVTSLRIGLQCFIGAYLMWSSFSDSQENFSTMSDIRHPKLLKIEQFPTIHYRSPRVFPYLTVAHPAFSVSSLETKQPSARNANGAWLDSSWSIDVETWDRPRSHKVSPNCLGLFPVAFMYGNGISTYIYNRHQPNVGKYSFHNMTKCHWGNDPTL